MNKEYKELEVLSARLAESVLMDWDKEEQGRLAKEVATKCHSIFNDKESREFVSLVKKMREAQVVEQCTRGGSLFEDTNNMLKHLRWLDKRERLESMVDEYLKKMEE